jgi:hypothetical protein
MPRRHYREPSGEPLDLERIRRGVPRVVSSSDGEWFVRPIAEGAAVKTYRCPGCDHEIGPGVAHVVVWPTDDFGGAAQRRHWHASCWTRRPK